jgi:hypothetical protein
MNNKKKKEKDPCDGLVGQVPLLSRGENRYHPP